MKSTMPRTLSEALAHIKKRDREIADLKEQLKKVKSQKTAAAPKTPLTSVLGQPKTPAPNAAEKSVKSLHDVFVPAW